MPNYISGAPQGGGTRIWIAGVEQLEEGGGGLGIDFFNVVPGAAPSPPADPDNGRFAFGFLMTTHVVQDPPDVSSTTGVAVTFSMVTHVVSEPPDVTSTTGAVTLPVSMATHVVYDTDSGSVNVEYSKSTPTEGPEPID